MWKSEEIFFVCSAAVNTVVFHVCIWVSDPGWLSLKYLHLTVSWKQLLAASDKCRCATSSMSLTVSWQQRPPDSNLVWTLTFSLGENYPLTCGELWCPGGQLPPTAWWIPNLRYTGATVVGPTPGRHRQEPPAEAPWSGIIARVTTVTTFSPRSHLKNSKSRRQLAGHAARTADVRNSHRSIVRKPEGNVIFGRPNSRWEEY